jgi:hypothetical protein
MTVGQLKKLLEVRPDEAIVLIHLKANFDNSDIDIYEEVSNAFFYRHMKKTKERVYQPSNSSVESDSGTVILTT